MLGLGDLNLRERLAPDVPAWVTEWVCAGACAALAGLLRVIVDLLVPTPPPYVFLYPLVLLATLLAGWRAGIYSLTIILLGVWYIVLFPARFGPLGAAEGVALLLNAISGLAVIAVAQAFRTSYRAAEAERAGKLEVRDLLLRELNHRVKNNFQMVESLLDMQRRRSASAGAEQALADALRRVHSMAQAHANLYSPDEAGDAIDLGAYLGDLCENLSDSLLLTGEVRLDSWLTPCPVSRDRAVAVGLVVNELVTNAAKYAFPAGRSGRILVSLRQIEAGCELTVVDDGVGMPPEAEIRSTGLGRKLVEGFARQAGGALTRGEGPGVSHTLVLPH
ncbi:sensor histidine kinase [Phenylobacterium sp.]|uniref:sensor histidine kinase n=1 Tax=Phenylobacterium sp. TaxID=1871053 RepID=UPI0028A18DD7|nr:sensor histidine kinase [Phenylobacterium sp.]